MLRKLVSVLSAAVLACGLVPVTAVAEEQAEGASSLQLEAGTYVEHEAVAYVVGDGSSDGIAVFLWGGSALDGILHRTGIGSEQTASGEASCADAIFRAMTKVSTASPFTPDGIVINPTDYQTLRLAKDSNNQYFGGGFFSGAYGNGGIAEQPPIWGLRTVVTPAIAAGTVLVGAFQQGASVIRRQGLTVEIANQNEDDFVNNRIAIRIEVRLALAVRYPAAFCKVTVAAEA